VGSLHDTALEVRCRCCPAGAGLGTHRPLLPFQRSSSGWSATPALARLVPTAMQLFGVAHETPTSALAIVCGFARLGTTDQPAAVPPLDERRVVPVVGDQAAHREARRGDAGRPRAHETPSR
jgi:hypothetical protein